jgi:hypothetical protein
MVGIWDLQFKLVCTMVEACTMPEFYLYQRWRLQPVSKIICTNMTRIKSRSLWARAQCPTPRPPVPLLENNDMQCYRCTYLLSCKKYHAVLKLWNTLNICHWFKVCVNISDLCSRTSMLMDGVCHFLALTDLCCYGHKDTSLNMKSSDLSKSRHTCLLNQFWVCLLLAFLDSSLLCFPSSSLEETCCLR